MPAPGSSIVSTAPSPAFFAAMVAYVVSSAFYVGTFTKLPAWVRKGARWALIAAFVAHAVDISWRGFEGVHPGTSVREALGFLSWIVCGSYLLLSRREAFSVVGSVVAPVALILLATARLTPSGEPVPGLGTVGRLHIAGATMGVAVFALATVVSMIYLVQDRNLKNKRFDALLFKESAALETLDRLANRLVVFGFPIFTLAMILGALWMSQLQEGFGRIEWPIAFITWLSYGSLIVGRTLWGWRGRRAALVTMVGFSASAIVLAIYLARRALEG